VRIQCLIRQRMAKARVEKLRWETHKKELHEQTLQQQHTESRQQSAALRIQAFWRMRHQQRRYHQLLTSALPRIQAFCWMICAKQAIERRRRNVVILQKHVRAFGTVRLRRQRHAAVTIQRAYRRRLLHSPEFCDITRVLLAVRRLQAAWRGHLVYWRYLRTLVATARLQAQARAWLGRRRYREKLDAARRLQAAMRAHLARKHFSPRRHEARLRVQAFGRLVLAHVRLCRYHTAARTIQAAWRRGHCRQREELWRRAATSLQAFFRMRAEQSRGWPARRRFHNFLRARALGWRVRAALRRRHQAATKIQQAYRRHRCLRRFAAAQRLVRLLQRIWRGRRSSEQT